MIHQMRLSVVVVALGMLPGLASLKKDAAILKNIGMNKPYATPLQQKQLGVT